MSAFAKGAVDEQSRTDNVFNDVGKSNSNTTLTLLTRLNFPNLMDVILGFG